jgi:hypothetical protein
MPRLVVAGPTPKVRDGGGRFAEGNAGGAQLRLLELEPSDAAEWARPYLERAQRRYAGARRSGLYKKTGSRLDGLLRSCVLLELQGELLTAEALKLPPKDARELFAEARTAMKEARAALLKLVALVGVRRGDGERGDPLANLVRELESEGGNNDE